MAPFNSVVLSAGLNRVQALQQALHVYAADQGVHFPSFALSWNGALPPVSLTVLTTWVATFSVTTTVALGLGFGPRGVAAGSAAAGFQAWMYGGFTPAAGIFATLTSMGMLGYFLPAVCVFSASVATVVAGLVWSHEMGL